jgi:phosphate transport system protein
MSKSLERDLGRLENDLLTAAGAVERSVLQAVAALRGESAALRRGGDEERLNGEDQIEEECLRLLALHQPVAGDLRRVAATMLIANELSRMADIAEDVAGRAEESRDLSACPPPPAALQTLADLTTALVRESLGSFVRLDPELARLIPRLRAEADRLAAEAADELAATMRDRPDCVEAGLALYAALGGLQRIADLAARIAGHVLNLLDG